MYLLVAYSQERKKRKKISPKEWYEPEKRTACSQSKIGVEAAAAAAFNLARRFFFVDLINPLLKVEDDGG